MIPNLTEIQRHTCEVMLTPTLFVNAVLKTIVDHSRGTF